MQEHEVVELGVYCNTMLLDPAFDRLVKLCEQNLSLEMLSSETIEDREKAHRTYLGLKELIDMMQQFVTVKDQIATKEEQEE